MPRISDFPPTTTFSYTDFLPIVLGGTPFGGTEEVVFEKASHIYLKELAAVRNATNKIEDVYSIVYDFSQISDKELSLIKADLEAKLKAKNELKK